MDSDRDLDHALSAERNVDPSTAFVRNVMAAVHQEASTPAPIAFPWKRVVSGLAIWAFALTGFLVLVVVQLKEEAGLVTPMPPVLVGAVQFAKSLDLGWVTLALLASLAPVRVVYASKWRRLPS